MNWQRFTIRSIACISLSATVVNFLIGLNLLAAACAADLPPAHQLISTAIEACGEPDSSNVWPRSEIAKALAYVGDSGKAQAVLAPYKTDPFVQGGYLGVAAVEIELAGKYSELPPALWNDDPHYTHWSLAVAYAKRGDVKMALQHLEEIPARLGTPLHLFGQRLVEPLLEQGKHDVARQVLKRWAECFLNTDSIHDFTISEVKRLVELLIVNHEPEAAQTLCQRWQAVVQAETDVADWGKYIGLSWTRLAASWAIVGNKQAAGDALQEAQLWLDKARATQTKPPENIDYLNDAAAYAEVGATQAFVFGENAGAATYERAYQFAMAVVDSDYGYYGFEKIVAAQLKAGDLREARRAVDRVPLPRERAKCFRAIAEHSLAFGLADTSRSAAKAMGQELDRDGFKAFMAHDMADCAATVALAGEKSVARKLFQRAISLSLANETPKFDHHWIARMQVKGGLYADAYATIQAIDDKSDRALPLAELARDVAKVEYQSSKK